MERVLIAKNDQQKKLKRKATTKLDDAKRYFRNFVKKISTINFVNMN